MFKKISSRSQSFGMKAVNQILAVFFITSLIIPPNLHAQPLDLALPVPGKMLELTKPYMPVTVKGLMVHPENPFRFDFLVDSGDTGLNVETHSNASLRNESMKLIKYFLAALTVPEEEMWVNLSPYEKDRIVPPSFGDTQMGRDLLAQDYILKQLAASLTYPEQQMGKKFWDKVYAEAQAKFGTSNIPVNTFNKVWILPSKAKVYEHGNGAFVVDAKLKVMLEQDYLALQKTKDHRPETKDLKQISQIVKEIVIPAIEKEVNEGEHFANLRQIYQAMILATWYKIRLKDSIIGKQYVNQHKTKGVTIDDKQATEKIYQQYLKAFKKGVYNYIKEDFDPAKQQTVPRKYVSGGATAIGLDEAMRASLMEKPDMAAVSGSLTPQGESTIVSWLGSLRQDEVVATPFPSVMINPVASGDESKKQAADAAMATEAAPVNFVSMNSTIVRTATGRSTLRVDTTVRNAVTGKVGHGYYVVPAGTSSGEDERPTEEDSIKLLKQVRRISTRINQLSQEWKGIRPQQLFSIGQVMVEMDKEDFLGAQGTLGAETSLSNAMADALGLQGYQYIPVLAPDLAPAKGTQLPRSQDVLTSGGRHGDGLDIQEIMAAPYAETPAKADQMVVEIDHKLGEIYKIFDLGADPDDQGKAPSEFRGPEGGYKVPKLTRNRVAEIYVNRELYKEDHPVALQHFDLERLNNVGIHKFALKATVAAIENAGYKADTTGAVETVPLALDLAASEMWNGEGYNYEGQRLTTEQWTDTVIDLLEEFPIESVEDVKDQNDWDGWMQFIKKLIDAKLGRRIKIVLDDVFVTQERRLLLFIEALKKEGFIGPDGQFTKELTDAVELVGLVKLNQNGFLTGTLEVIRLLREHHFKVNVSHRSQEAEAQHEEATIVDVAVGVGAEYLKIGNPRTDHRQVKFNRLVAIDQQLRDAAMIGLQDFLQQLESGLRQSRKVNTERLYYYWDDSSVPQEKHGGIDLNRKALDLQIDKDKAMMAPFKNMDNIKIDALYPFILDVVSPVPNMPMMLGFDPKAFPGSPQPRPKLSKINDPYLRREVLDEA